MQDLKIAISWRIINPLTTVLVKKQTVSTFGADSAYEPVSSQQRTPF